MCGRASLPCKATTLVVDGTDDAHHLHPTVPSALQESCAVCESNPEELPARLREVVYRLQGSEDDSPSYAGCTDPHLSSEERRLSQVAIAREETHSEDRSRGLKPWALPRGEFEKAQWTVASEDSPTTQYVDLLQCVGDGYDWKEWSLYCNRSRPLLCFYLCPQESGDVHGLCGPECSPDLAGHLRGELFRWGDGGNVFGRAGLFPSLVRPPSASEPTIALRWWCHLISLVGYSREGTCQQSSINTHIAMTVEPGSAPNVDMYIARVGRFPERIKNLFFTYLFVLRAVGKAAPMLEAMDFGTGV